LDAKHQKIEDKLNSASPAKFDKDYIKAQLEAHIETIALFKSYAESGQPEAVRFRIAAVESWRSRQSHHRLGCRAGGLTLEARDRHGVQTSRRQ
jgi:putative membrane protein